MKNGVLLADESECGNGVEPWAKHFLAESSDTQALHAHFCPNFQPIYQQMPRTACEGVRAKK